MTTALPARDVLLGNPRSATHQPKNAEVANLFLNMQEQVEMGLVAAMPIYETRALAYAAAAQPSGVKSVWVTNDPNLAFNGIYAYLGGTGAGAFRYIGDKFRFDIVAASGAAGTANAITAVTDNPVSDGTIVSFKPIATTTGSATISFNGGAALTIKKTSGGNIANGDITANMSLLGVIRGSNFELFSDIASQAIVAQCQAIKDSIDLGALDDAVAATETDRIAVAADKTIVAADKAVVAADKAVVAADKNTAISERTLAQAARTGAETARDSTFVNAQRYFATTAAGLAGSIDGQQFSAPVGNAIQLYTRTNATTATPVAGALFPTSAAVDAATEFLTAGWATTPALTNDAASTYRFLVNQQRTGHWWRARGTLRIATTLRFIVATLNTTTGAHTVIGERSFVLPIGPFDVCPNLDIPAGAYHGAAGQISFALNSNPAGIGVWAANSVSDTGGVLLANAQNSHSFFTDISVPSAGTAMAAYENRLDSAETQIGGPENIGWAGTIVATGSIVPSPYQVRFGPSAAIRRIRGITAGRAAIGTVTIFAHTMSGNNVGTILGQTAVTMAAGVDTKPLDFTIPAGAHCTIDCGGMYFQNTGGGSNSFVASAPMASGLNLSTPNSHRMEMNLDVVSGFQSLFLGAVGGAVQKILPDDPRITPRGFFEITERNALKLYGKRPVVDGQGFEWSAPGAFVEFWTDSASLSVVGDFYPRTVRDDASFDDAVEILVGSTSAGLLVGTTTNNTPTIGARGTFNLGAAGTLRRVRILWPYGDSFDLRSIEIDAGAAIGAPAPATGLVMVASGDSITQGYSVTKASASWPWVVAETNGWRLLNLGYGGSVAQTNFMTAAGNAVAAFGANATIVRTIGVNNCIGGATGTTQTPIATFKATIAAEIAAARAAAPLAKIVMVAPFRAPNLETLTQSRTILLNAYRTAIQEAVNESSAGNIIYINGLDALPTGGQFTDGIHPTDSDSATIAAWLATRI